MSRRLGSALAALQFVAFATLLRSVAYDRWITVLAATLLLVGATAAARGRTWGIALSLAQAIAFPVAWLIGIAPLWFAFVGVAGALPFLITAGAFARFDKRATALLVTLATIGGAGGAIAWKAYAWDVIGALPTLYPSTHLQHGLALAVLSAAGLAAHLRGLGRRAHETDARVRVGGALGEESHVRIAASSDADSELMLDEAAEPARRASSRVA